MRRDLRSVDHTDRPGNGNAETVDYAAWLLTWFKEAGYVEH